MAKEMDKRRINVAVRSLREAWDGQRPTTTLTPTLHQAEWHVAIRIFLAGIEGESGAIKSALEYAVNSYVFYGEDLPEGMRDRVHTMCHLLGWVESFPQPSP